MIADDIAYQTFTVEAKYRARTAREAGPESGALDEACTQRVVAGGRLVRTRRLQDPTERRRG